MGYGIKEIEDLIITALNAAPLNGYCKTIESYAGQFEEEDPKKIAAITNIFPVVYVMHEGSRLLAPPGMSVPVREMGFSVIAAAKSVKGQVDAAKQSGGAYQMCDDIYSQLQMNDLGKPDIFGLMHDKSVLLASTRNIVAYTSSFSLYFPA